MASKNSKAPGGANLVEPNATDTEVAITDAPGAQGAIVGATGAESDKDATDGNKSAQSAPVRATRGKAKAKSAAKPATPKKQAAPKRKSKATGASKDVTLGDLPDLFAAHLTAIGKSAGTVFSYSMELKTAANVLGEKTKVRTLTAKKVAEFFASDAVMLKRGGKPKSELSTAKTRRVFRQAMTWLAEKGVIAKAPLPTDEKK